MSPEKVQPWQGGTGSLLTVPASREAVMSGLGQTGPELGRRAGQSPGPGQHHPSEVTSGCPLDPLSSVQPLPQSTPKWTFLRASRPSGTSRERPEAAWPRVPGLGTVQWGGSPLPAPACLVCSITVSPLLCGAERGAHCTGRN